MKNTGRTGAVAKKKVPVITAKTKPGENNAAALPFAHRTPNQLHASTYVRRRG